MDFKNIDEFAQWVRSNWYSVTDDSDNPKVLDERDLFIMVTGLAGETGEALEKLKKRTRDGHFELDAFAKEMGDVIHYWTQICNYFGLTPSDVIKMNHEKIVDRKARGVRRGSGDNR